MRALRLAPIVFTLALFGCHRRSDVWTKPPTIQATYGMSDAVAFVDDGAHRVVFAAPTAAHDLTTTFAPIGRNVVASAVSKDRSTVFVLSSGDQPRKSDEDALPSLDVVTRPPGGEPTTRSFALAAPLSGMTLDPLGRYVALHASTTSTTTAASASRPFVENPNEVVIVDLTASGDAALPVSRTLRSFGGRPQRFTFTPVLALPGGPRRLLVVETSEDVSLVDLDHLHDATARPEITVRLGSGSTSKVLKPSGLVIDDGDPARTDDARIAIRSSADSSVVTLTLGPAAAPVAGTTPPPNPNDFSPVVNLVDVGGVATDLAFVRTDGGLRIAAIVPSAASAMLIEPDTGLTQKVALPAAYQSVSLITQSLTTTPGADVALLYGGSASSQGVAFWSLGKTAGQPYRAVEVIGVGGDVESVIDVPPPRPELKILKLRATTTTTPSFAVLNLRDRTAAPLLASASSSTVDLVVSPDGERAWAYQRGATNLASIALADIHPTPIVVERGVDAVYDVAAEAGGDRALVAVHLKGSGGLTVFDAKKPDGATGVAHAGLLLEGLP